MFPSCYYMNRIRRDVLFNENLHSAKAINTVVGVIGDKKILKFENSSPMALSPMA